MALHKIREHRENLLALFIVTHVTSALWGHKFKIHFIQRSASQWRDAFHSQDKSIETGYFVVFHTTACCWKCNIISTECLHQSHEHFVYKKKSEYLHLSIWQIQWNLWAIKPESCFPYKLSKLGSTVPNAQWFIKLLLMNE